MKVDFNALITDLAGKPLPQTTDDSPAATLGYIVANALIAVTEASRNEDASKKVKSFDLALKVHAGGVLDFKAEELTLMKEKVNQAYPSALVVARAYELLERSVDGLRAVDSPPSAA